MKKTILIVSLLILAGCIPARQLTNDQAGYLAIAATKGTTFTLPKASVKDAWGRGQAFVTKNSDMRIQIATDYALSTYDPSGSSFGYDLSQAPEGDSSLFTVECSAGNFMYNKDAQNNALACAYYMISGKEPPPGLVLKYGTDR